MLNEHGKLRISPSKLMNWKDCPRLFKASMESERSDNIYSCIGTAAHAVCEAVNKGKNLSAEERERMMEAVLFEECKKNGVAMQFNKAFELSLLTVKNYTPPKGKLINSERKRVLEFDDFVFVYIIDMEYSNEADTMLHIRDFKTSAKVPATPLQLMLYTWGEVERLSREGIHLPGESVIGEFHMLRNDKVHSYPMSSVQVHETGEWVKSQVKMMHALNKLDKSDDPKWKGKAFPEIAGAGCHFCPRLECTSRVSSTW